VRRPPGTKPGFGPVVLGLDLSLRGAGAVVLPGDWDPRRPNAGVVAHRFTQEGKLEGRHRQAAIVRGIWQLAVRHGVTDSYVEEHSFSKGLMSHAYARAELVGAVKNELWTSLAIETVPVVASSARKLLFGPQRRMNTKEWKQFIAAGFQEMGLDLPDEDTRDAAVVANAGRHRLGLLCLSVG
jgi:hypothetical protein